MSDEKRNNPSFSDLNDNNNDPVEIDADEIILEPDEEELLIPLDDDTDDNDDTPQSTGQTPKANVEEAQPSQKSPINETNTTKTQPKVVDANKAENAKQNSMTYPLLALMAIAAVSLIQIWMAGKTGLGDAEAYYYSFSKHLGLSYYDHPPGIAYLISLGTLWMGDTVLGVRIVSIIVSALSAFVLYLLTTNLFNSGRSGLFATLLFLVTPLIFVGGSSASPDVAMVLMWLFASWLLSRSISKGDPIYLIATGIVVGLGLLCKYFMIFFWPAAILYLLFARGYKLLFSIWFLLAILFTIVFFTPVLIWNYQHDWVSFSYHLFARHTAANLSTSKLLHFIGGQALYLSPLIFVALILSVVKSAINIFKHKGKDTQLLFWLTVPVLALIYVIGAWTSEAEPHWALLGYVLVYPTLGNWLANLNDKPATMFERVVMMGPLAFWFTPKRRNLLFGWLIGLPTVLLGFLIIHLTTDTFTSLIDENLLDDPKYDISNELTGWDEVGITLKEEMAKLGKGSFLASYHYAMCGQLNFATQNRYPVKCLSRRTDAFDFFYDPLEITGKNAIFVTDNRYNDRPESRIVCKYGITDLDTIKIIRDGIKVRQFEIYRCNEFVRMLKDGEQPPAVEPETTEKPAPVPEEVKADNKQTPDKPDVPEINSENIENEIENKADENKTQKPDSTLQDEQVEPKPEDQPSDKEPETDKEQTEPEPTVTEPRIMEL